MGSDLEIELFLIWYKCMVIKLLYPSKILRNHIFEYYALLIRIRVAIKVMCLSRLVIDSFVFLFCAVNINFQDFQSERQSSNIKAGR